MTSFLPVVLADLGDNGNKRKNLYLISGLFAFVWINFHFIVVYFFGFILKSALLVGFFLGISNFIAFLIDGPFGALQKYITSKKFFLISAACMLITACIFLKFIYFSPQQEAQGVVSMLEKFLFQDGLNAILLLIAAILYGVAREIINITTLSYILNNTDPSEYAHVMSKNNLATGSASVLGFLCASIILTQNPVVGVAILVGLLAILMFFIQMYFDNPYKTINFSDIQRIKIINKRETIEKMKEYVVERVQKADFAQMAKNTQYLFIKPIELKDKIDMKEVLEATKKNFECIRKVLFEIPRPVFILWALSIVGFFGFWDTFVSTFQVDFLEKILNLNRTNPLVEKKILSGYIMLGMLALPVFLLPDFFVKLSKKIGALYVILGGVLLSAISLILFSFSSSLILVIVLGLTNSAGYAAAMTLGQSIFLDTYNNMYAQKFWLHEIDANASAAPLMMIQNLANVVGLIFWGMMVTMVGFNMFFLLCGLLLLGIFLWSLRRLSDLDV